MNLLLSPLETEQALAILTWRYPHPYDCYNFDTDTAQADLSYLLNPENAFFAILNRQGELEGYCSFGLDGQVPGGDYSADALDIGMGIRPDLVGQGRGKYYAQAVAQHGLEHCDARQLRVTIATFNKRAQRVWATLGFKPVTTFTKTYGGRSFVVMSKVVTD